MRLTTHILAVLCFACCVLALTLPGCKSKAKPNFEATLSLPPDQPDLSETSLVAELETRARALNIVAKAEAGIPGDQRLTVWLRAADRGEALTHLDALCESGRISIRSVNDRTAFLLDIAHKDPSQFPEDHEIRPYELGQGTSRKIEKLAISRAEIVNTSHVESAEASRGKENIVRISLTAKGGELMRDATKKMRKGRSRLAIIYDERIISAPVVAEEIWSRLILEGFNTFEEAKALATALNTIRLKKSSPSAPPSKTNIRRVM